MFSYLHKKGLDRFRSSPNIYRAFSRHSVFPKIVFFSQFLFVIKTEKTLKRPWKVTTYRSEIFGSTGNWEINVDPCILIGNIDKFVSLVARSSRSLRQKWRSSRGKIQKLRFRKFYLVSHVDWMLKYATVAFIFCLRALAVSEERANLFSILGFGNLSMLYTIRTALTRRI